MRTIHVSMSAVRDKQSSQCTVSVGDMKRHLCELSVEISLFYWTTFTWCTSWTSSLTEWHYKMINDHCYVKIAVQVNTIIPTLKLYKYIYISQSSTTEYDLRYNYCQNLHQEFSYQKLWIKETLRWGAIMHIVPWCMQLEYTPHHMFTFFPSLCQSHE